MALDDVQDGATNPIIPFVGEVDLSAGVIVALIVGLTLIAMIRPLSESVADTVSSQVADATGFNPQTGDTTGPNEGAFA